MAEGLQESAANAAGKGMGMSEMRGDVPGEPGEGGSTAAPESRPPVSEEISWRSRAIDAETKLQDLERALSELRQTLEQTRDALETSERRAKLAALLEAQDVIDAEVGLMLAEAAMKAAPQRTPAEIVAELRATRPFLFGPGRSIGAGGAASPGVMGSVGEEAAGGELAVLAEQARATGDRRLLMRYLERRRGHA